MEKQVTALKEKKLILCIDVGDGECAGSYRMVKNGRPEAAHRLEFEDEFRFPTVMGIGKEARLPSLQISYEGERVYIHIKTLGSYVSSTSPSEFSDVREMDTPTPNVTIGEKDPEEGVDVASNFKMAPPCPAIEDDEGWNACYEGTEHSYLDHMAAFLWHLFRKIYASNPSLKGIDFKDTAIFIGCPSSEEWTAPTQIAQYRALLHLVTGIGSVFIIPESMASAYGAVRINQSICLMNGIVVLDFGSSTADFTYLYGCNAPIHHSRPLGAKHVEAQMRMRLHAEEDAPPCYLTSGREVFGLRVDAKERYFIKDRSKENRTRALSYHYQDEKVKIDDAFMREVLDAPFEVRWYDPTGKEMRATCGWRAHCESFLTYCKNLIPAELPVTHVILVGGASNMHFVEETCEKTFADMKRCDGKGENAPRVLHDVSPSDGVTNGLCVAAGNYFEMLSLLEEQMLSEEKLHDLTMRLWERCTAYFEGTKNYLHELLTGFVDRSRISFLPMSPALFEAKAEEAMVRALRSSDGELRRGLDNEYAQLREELEAILSDYYAEVSDACSERLYGRKKFFLCTYEDEIGWGRMRDNPYDIKFCRGIGELLSGETVQTYKFKRDYRAGETNFFGSPTKWDCFYARGAFEIMKRMRMPCEMEDGVFVPRLTERFGKMLEKDIYRIVATTSLVQESAQAFQSLSARGRTEEADVSRESAEWTVLDDRTW